MHGSSSRVWGRRNHGMTVTVTLIVGIPVIDQERLLIGHDLHYVTKFSFLSQCLTSEQNDPSARKSEQRGMSVVCVQPHSDEVEETCTRRATDQAPSQASQDTREEAIPKSIARVLNASHIRSEWKQSLGKRKRRDEERGAEVCSQRKSRKRSKMKGSDAGAASEDAKHPPIRIQPGESLVHFNKLSIRRSSKPMP